MKSHRIGRAILLAVPAAYILALLSCSSPTALTGQVVVYVFENGTSPVQGKTIEIVGTPLTQVTDQKGRAEFTLPTGAHLVRAYGIGTPGPPPPYVERSVHVKASQTSRLEIWHCPACR